MLKSKQRQLEKELSRTIYEIEDINDALEEIKPFIGVSNSIEYVQSLSKAEEVKVDG